MCKPAHSKRKREEQSIVFPLRLQDQTFINSNIVPDAQYCVFPEDKKKHIPMFSFPDAKQARCNKMCKFKHENCYFSRIFKALIYNTCIFHITLSSACS